MFKVKARDQGHYKGPSGAFVTYCNISCFSKATEAIVVKFHLNCDQTPGFQGFRIINLG